MIASYKCVGDNIIPIHKIIAYKTSISEYDDVIKNNNDILIKSWALSEQGNFFITHAISLKIEKCKSVDTMSILVAVVAEIEESKLVEYYLKFPKEN